jgi:internalin A
MSSKREPESPNEIAEARIQAALGEQAGRLDLSQLGLTTPPESLGKLSGLRTLELPNNRLTSLPEWLGNLSRLQALDLSGNQLTSLPAGMRELRALTDLFLHDNPALGLPLEVLGPRLNEVSRSAQKKPAAIFDYYFRARDSARPLNEGKVILEGRGEVGKTSLVNHLTKNAFNEGEEKTHGIQISQWEVRAGADDVRLNV